MAAVFWDQKDIVSSAGAVRWACVSRCGLVGLWRGAAPCPVVWLGCEQ